MDFSLPLAGPVPRLMALWLDLLVVSVAGIFVQRLADTVRIVSEDAAAGLSILLYFAISFFYGIVTEWIWQGQTIGKRVLKIRVMDRDGLPMNLAQIVVRNLLRPVDMLPAFYLLGGVVALSTRYGQRIGDLAANTVVVRTRQVSLPDLQNLFAGKFNSLLEYPHLAARLRQRVPPAVAGIALDALLRRDTLDADARVRIFRELAARLRKLVEFPAEAMESLSDEHFVRNVVEIVYRSKAS
jgi:uncharacterized RDD family membrane protein YckC